MADLIRDNLQGYLDFRRSRGFTVDRDSSHIKSFASYLDEKKIKELSSVDAAFIMTYSEHRLKSILPLSMNCEFVVLNNFFQYLRQLKLCKENPLHERIGFRSHDFCPYVFTDEEVDRILNSFSDAACRVHKIKSFYRLHSHYCAFFLIAMCGLRISEACKLRLEDVDLNGKTLFIHQTKFRKDRRIPVSSTVVDVIKNYLEVRKCYDGAQPSEYLIVSCFGSRYRRKSLDIAFAKKMKELGLYRDTYIRGNTIFGSPRPHSLRHAFAVRTIRRWKSQGLPIDQIADTLATYMGHSQFTSTQVYLKALSTEPGILILKPYHNG